MSELLFLYKLPFVCAIYCCVLFTQWRLLEWLACLVQPGTGGSQSPYRSSLWPVAPPR